MRLRSSGVALILLVSLAACTSVSPPPAGMARPSTATRVSQSSPIPPPTPTPPDTSGIPNFHHIVVLVMENKGYEDVIGSSAAPYLNHLAEQYGLAASYYAATHPSLPNYLELLGGSTFGVTSNCVFCGVDAPNLVDQLEAAHKTWKAYIEDMPAPCSGGFSLTYVPQHNPFLYFDDIRNNPARCANVVPFTGWRDDLAANRLPDFAWITPNLCHDTHNCSVREGDAWLQSLLPSLFASPDWQQSALFLVWDEGFGDAGCCQTAHGGHVPMLLISPLGKPGFASTVNYDHASLLLTIEQAWRLGKLGEADCPCTAAMSDFFVG